MHSLPRRLRILLVAAALCGPQLAVAGDAAVEGSDRKVGETRTAVIPLRMYLKDGMVTVEVGVVRGRRAYDKRQVIAAREAGRTMQRALRHSVR